MVARIELIARGKGGLASTVFNGDVFGRLLVALTENRARAIIGSWTKADTRKDFAPWYTMMIEHSVEPLDRSDLAPTQPTPPLGRPYVPGAGAWSPGAPFGAVLEHAIKSTFAGTASSRGSGSAVSRRCKRSRLREALLRFSRSLHTPRRDESRNARLHSSGARGLVLELSRSLKRRAKQALDVRQRHDSSTRRQDRSRVTVAAAK